MDATEPTREPPDSDAPTLRDTPGPADPTRPDHAADVLPGIPRRLGPYELIERLGQGGMGVVFRARHEKLGTPCAVKVLIAGEHASPAEIARFQREASAVARMGKHPNIVAVYDLDSEGNLAYYAMELVEGVTLSAHLRSHPLSPEEGARLVEKVARAVHFAHEHGIVHRDLKPDNVIVRVGGDGVPEPQVMDFGLARDVHSSERLSVRGDVMGSPNYMAPEQALGEVDATDARTDVYGLGGILYEVLAGFAPHPGRVLAEVLAHVLRGEVIPPRSVRPEVPRDLETVCLKCLRPERAARYATAGEVADDLARFLRREPVRARPVGLLGRTARRVRRHPVLSALVAAIGVLVAGLAWRFLGPAWIVVPTCPEDARVQINGRPLRESGLIWPAGEIIVTVQAPGYTMYVRTESVTPGTFRTLKTVSLERDHGLLVVDSVPSDADLWVDGAPTGARTPIGGLAVPNGLHRLSLRLEGHEPYEELFRIVPDQPTDLGRAALVHEKGTLSIAGDPPGMTVVVREDATGREVARLSPPVAVPIDTGVYRIEARLEGHFAREQRVSVGVRTTAEVRFALTPQVVWAARPGGAIGSSPVLADLDGDGALDCVVGSNDHRVYALSGRDGAVLWTFETGGEAAVLCDPVDLDRDGVLDCVVGSDDRRVYALSGRDGTVLWTAETGEGAGWSSALLADLDGDGRVDAIVPSTDHRVYVLSGIDGHVIWKFDAGGDTLYAPPVAIADLDGDGIPDAVVGCEDHRVLALSGRVGGEIWSFDTGGEVHSAPSFVLADLDRDGIPDCIVEGVDRRVIALSGKSGVVLWSHEGCGALCSTGAVPDVDGDGVPDPAVDLEVDCVAVLSGRDGRPAKRFKAVDRTGDRAYGSPVLADLDRDGSIDCVFVSDNGRFQAVSGASGEPLWSGETDDYAHWDCVPADLDGDGRPDCLFSSSRTAACALDARTGAVVWSCDGPWASFSSPLVANVDGDGEAELVVAFEDGRVCLLRAMDGGDFWRFRAGTRVDGAPAMGDLNGDGVADCVIAGEQTHHTIWALSGHDGVVLWSAEAAGSTGATLSADLNGDGVPDPVFVGQWLRVRALSGKDGAKLWEQGFGGTMVSTTPVLRDLDGVLECLVGTWKDERAIAEDGVWALSARDGTVRWSRDTHEGVNALAALGDMNGDGAGDCVVVTGGYGPRTLRALSGRGGLEIWKVEGDEAFTAPAIADLDGDGRLEVIVGCWDGTVRAITGRDGATLWSHAVGSPVSGAPAIVDLDRDGAPDVVVSAEDHAIYALSGKGGALLWSSVTGGARWVLPACFDLDGDGVTDLVVASADRRLHALSGRDGDELWTRATGGGAPASVAVADLDGDGQPEWVVDSSDGWVHAMRGRAPVARTAAERWGEARSTAVLARARSASAWTALARLADECVRSARDPWTRAVGWLHLGIARARTADAAGALEAFAECRKLGLDPPDGAVEEWIVAAGWAECPLSRRTEATEALLRALALSPDSVLDALVECRGRARGAAVAFRDACEEALRRDVGRGVPALLLALPMPDGTRPFLPADGARDRLLAERAGILERLARSEGSTARSLGYLALVADALGEREALRRALASWADLPRRPGSLARLLDEAASRK